MSSDLWGIPGTGKVPDPEKEIKKLIDRAKREAQAEINKIAAKAESDTKRSMARFARVTQRGINQVRQPGRAWHQGRRRGGGRQGLDGRCGWHSRRAPEQAH